MNQPPQCALGTLFVTGAISSLIASIAQLGERGTEVAKVTGSIPVGGILFLSGDTYV